VIWTDIDTETRSAIQIVVIPAAMLALTLEYVAEIALAVAIAFAV
jgi:hypothetical protein